MMAKALHLNFKHVEPSSLQAPFRYSITEKKNPEDDLPDLTSSSCASDHGSSNKKRPQVPQEAMPISIVSDVSESFRTNHDELVQDENDHDDNSFLPPCPLQEEPTQQLNQYAPSTSGVLTANQVGIAADREQRLVVSDCIPTDIVLLPDYYNAYDDSQEESGSSSLEDRLEYAEELIHAYQDTIRSNEHLIESLYKTVAKTREEAMNMMSVVVKTREEAMDIRRDLEMALHEMELPQDVEEEEKKTDMVPEPKVFIKMMMATSLLLYFFGLTTEYPLIASVMVFLLEGFM